MAWGTLVRKVTDKAARVRKERDRKQKEWERKQEEERRPEREKLEAENKRKKQLSDAEGEINRWLRSKGVRALAEAMSDLKIEIPLGNLQMTTFVYKREYYGSGSSDYYTHKKDERKQNIAVWLKNEYAFPKDYYYLEIDVETDRCYEGTLVGEWCRESLEKRPDVTPLDSLKEIVMVWLKENT